MTKEGNKKKKKERKEKKSVPNSQLPVFFFFGSGPESEIAKRYKKEESLVFFLIFHLSIWSGSLLYPLFFSLKTYLFFLFGPQPSPITLYSDSFDQSSPCRDSTLPLQQPCRPHHCLHLITHLHLPCHLHLLP